MTTLAAGDSAPSFDLVDADGQSRTLASFGAGALVLYFYPAALTPGCTIEAIDFTAHRAAFEAAGYKIVGVSPDTPAKLARFIESKDLTVTLLADPDKTTINAYGAWGTKMLYGKAIEGVIRSTFVVDVDACGKGTIRLAQYGVKATGHVDRLARDLGIAAE